MRRVTLVAPLAFALGCSSSGPSQDPSDASADALLVDARSSDATATDSSRVDSRSDSPVADSPTDSPVADSPTDSPVADSPVADPPTDSQVADSPVADSPGVDAPASAMCGACAAAKPVCYHVNAHDGSHIVSAECIAVPGACSTTPTCDCAVQAIGRAWALDAGASSFPPRCPGNGPLYCDGTEGPLTVRCNPP